MTQLRFFRSPLVTVFLAAVFLTGAAQGQIPNDPSADRTVATGTVVKVQLSQHSPGDDEKCVIYSLKDLGDDADFAKWIADTIPQVIEPGSWSKPDSAEQKRVVRYFAPKQILVVYHTAAVQAKVDGFLKDLKKSAAKESKTTKGASRKDAGVIQAGFQESVPASRAPDPTSGYPVPAQATQPKHLFHFIIRYEGAGIVDDHVAEVIKQGIDKCVPSQGNGASGPSVAPGLPPGFPGLPPGILSNPPGFLPTSPEPAKESGSKKDSDDKKEKNDKDNSTTGPEKKEKQDGDKGKGSAAPQGPGAGLFRSY